MEIMSDIVQIIVLLFLLFMKCITITKTSNLDLLSNHELGRGLVRGGEGRYSNVNRSAAAKKKYYQQYQSQCLDKERDALLLFKSGITDYSGLLLSWSSQREFEDCCKWWGVVCSSRTGHVIELSLQGLGAVMEGKISPLLQLHHLNYLDLSGNNFSDQSIPKFMGSLTKLKYLDLSNSEFGGTIPSQLGNLSNLNYLAINDNDHLETNLVEWLPHLTSLRHLYLDSVDLSKAIHWPDIINSLPFLSHVSFMSCQLPNVTYPSPFMINSSSTTSSSITDLNLSYNNLTSSIFRYELFNLSTSMVNLTLSNNQLRGPIPQDFGKFTSLALLDLSHNQLEDGIPKSFRNLCSLRMLYLSSNNISGNLADSLKNLQSGCAVVTLEILDVSYNNLTGSLPNDIVRFSSMKCLYLAYNTLNGNVSENLGKLSKLELLDLSFNSLALVVNSTWVPSFQLLYLTMISCKPGLNSLNWIQTQKNLVNLDLSNSGISADIPMSFWNQLTSLNYLNLSNNQIRGKVPDFPANSGIRSDETMTIDLSSNVFEGPIPIVPSNVEALYLFKNNLSGSLSVLCQYTKKDTLIFLDLSHNLLNGSLPDCLMQFTGLEDLNLAYNNFSQNIPNSIGSLVDLESLNLHDNNFFGELPSSLRNCTSLKFLDVGENKLSGDILPWIGEELELYVVRLRSNNFSGDIPLHLCQLTNIQILDLSINSLVGSIPPCLYNLTAMVDVNDNTVSDMQWFVSEYYDEYFDSASVEWKGRVTEFGKNLALLKIIDLSSNQLTGEVPNAITKLRGLVVLNLARNNLHGKIPDDIGQLNSLQSLNFSRNGFSGHIPMGMSMLSFLSNLDLSYNNFSGRIPSGTQLQSFDPTSYVGNAGLCGSPLAQKCPSDELPPIVPHGHDYYREDNDDEEFLIWLYIGMSTGFITGFWGVCGPLFLNRRCRHAFFRFLDSLKDSLYVKVAIHLRNHQV